MAEAVMDESRLQRPKRQARMSAKRKASLDQNDEETKNRLSFNDFFNFCNFVLAYEEKLASQPVAPSHETANSVGESSHSSSSDSTSESSDESVDGDQNPSSVSSTTTTDSKESEKLEYTSEDESWNLVTCFCRRPFAGRPMIECSTCSTWIHMFCAKLRKEDVPEIYVCPRCLSKKKTKGSQAKKPRLT